MPGVICDSKPIATGIVVSARANRVLSFLEGCAGAPEKAVELIYRRYFRRSLKILRGAGYVRRCWCSGQNPLWVPLNYDVPRNLNEYLGRSALGWLAARMVQAGGDFVQGVAVFPNGNRYQVVLYPPADNYNGSILVVSLNGERPSACKGFWVDYNELREKELKYCLKVL